MSLSARDITVRRDKRPLLDGVSLTAGAGRFVALLGPNGAGKTTLLRALAGIAPPDGGTVAWNGTDITRLPKRTLGRTISYLAQSGRIHWSMTVRNVVGLGRLPHSDSFGSNAAADAAAVRRAMEAADVIHLSERTTATLSGGERGRVLLARALAVQAQALLADEPMAALDPFHQIHTMETLAAEARRGVAVVAALHDLTLAARYCDEAVLLKGGQVVAAGPVGAVLTPERLEEVYGVGVARGEIGGEPFILPWGRLPGPPAPLPR